MYDWTSIVTELSATESILHADQNYIDRQFDEINKRLKILDAKIDQQVLIGARTAFRHLLDGINSDVEKVRMDEFVMARREFNRLASLPSNGTTTIDGREIDNEYLISLGYWGNHHYFNLQNDKKNSLLQVYECTEEFPVLGLSLFSSKFFSKDFSFLITKNLIEYKEYEKLLNNKRSKNFWAKVRYYAKQSFRVTASGGVAAGGIAAGIIIKALTAGIGAVPGIAVAGAGLRAANEVYEKLKVDKPEDYDIKKLEKSVEKLKREAKKIFQELEKECRTRRQELQSVSLREFLELEA